MQLEPATTSPSSTPIPAWLQKPFLDRGQSVFEHVHDPKAHIVFADEDRADLLREIPQRPD
jgi:hypothetical protein